jgi:NAD(P)-dependent dehydrogenase (short-subunit alcohol dehydrogenase family)/rhamnose utilization protein RhaD (predicted bifunctional aldolase and dehydrogenase)
MAFAHAPGGGTERAPRSAAAAGAAPEPPEVADLVRISRAAGGDPDLVQGAGGNTSIKSRDGKSIFIKTSGSLLGEMDAASGWAELDLEATRRIWLDEDLAKLPPEAREARVDVLLRAAVRRPAGVRPSVETGLHVLLDRVVVHTHPVGLNAFLSSSGSREGFEAVLGDAAAHALYIRYTDPGYTLAAAARREMEAYRALHGRLPAVVLLENHGLFTAAADADRALELTLKAAEAGMRWLGSARVNPVEFRPVVEPAAASAGPAPAAAVRGALLRGGSAPCIVRADAEPAARGLAASAAAVAAASRGAITPDQAVYARVHPLVLEGPPAGWDGAVRSYRERHRADPRVVLVPPGAGGPGSVFHAAPDLGGIRAVGDVARSAMASVLRNLPAGPRLLEAGHVAFLDMYQGLASARPAPAGRVAGRIACITGAASGLGKGIARGLAAEGATVFALDLNAGALDAARADFPRGRYVPFTCDVTDEGSVAAAFGALAASLGGLDFLVNAAGIAPSFPLVDFPAAAWRKALEINLTGYFLCAREAARLLIRQGAGGSIINVASKTGLEASKDNSAYNATKAGEVHLMRGWALELGSAGIRVNCVAPGNVFKGSQIWSEEYIRACARKKGIRPEEVIPYYTSLSALGKEIEPGDVAAAVLFLVSDESRNITGQTLVVDGGQVMVR